MVIGVLGGFSIRKINVIKFGERLSGKIFVSHPTLQFKNRPENKSLALSTTNHHEIQRSCSYHTDISMKSVKILQFPDAYLKRRSSDVLRPKSCRVFFTLKGDMLGCKQH